jgi:hypothetical protein
MLDMKATSGAVIVAMAAANSWIEVVSDYTSLAVNVVGVLVGIATLWYTVERARKLRAERKEQADDHKDTRGDT